MMFATTIRFFLSSWLLITATNAATPASEYEFVKSGPLYAGANGMGIDENNVLYVSQVIAGRIANVDRETGDIINVILPPEGFPMFADDATVAKDGSVYFADFVAGTIGVTTYNSSNYNLFYEPGTYPSANPIALDDTQTRLFFSQCFVPGITGVYELNLDAMETTTLVEGIEVCASNSMEYINGYLYTPRLFEGRVVRIDLENNNAVENVVTDLGLPVAVKANNAGELFVADAAVGKIFQVLDYENPPMNTSALNSGVVDLAGTPFTSITIDNIIFDSDDRMFVTNFGTGALVEVLSPTEVRDVVPSIFGNIYGILEVNDTLHTVSFNGIIGLDVETGALDYEFLPVIGTGALETPSVIVEYDRDEDLVLLPSVTAQNVMLFDLAKQEAVFTGHGFGAPVDALAFRDGFLVTDLLANATLQYVTGDEMENRETMLEMPGLTFLTSDPSGTHVYATNYFTGQVLQLYESDNLLSEPVEIASGLAGPEGIAYVDESSVVVLQTVTGELTRISLMDGSAETLVEGMVFHPSIPNILPLGLPNDVLVSNGIAYFASDMDNVLYKAPLGEVDGEEGLDVEGPMEESEDPPTVVSKNGKDDAKDPTEAAASSATNLAPARSCYAFLTIEFLLLVVLMLSP